MQKINISLQGHFLKIPAMKKFLALSLFIVMNLAVIAQPTLIGMRNGSAGNEVVRWHALDSTTIETFQTPLLGYMLSSASFDAYNGNYYLAGVIASGNCLFSFNSPTGEMSTLPFSAASNITAIDMSTGSIYTITVDSTGSFNVNKMDPATGNISLLGVVILPGYSGLVVDATTFDSEHGILIAETEDNSGNPILCRIFVRDPVFTYDFIPILAPNPQCNFTSFQYDNLNNHLLSLKMDYSAGSGTLSLVEINDSTGSVNEIGPIPPMNGFQAGSSCFDQQTSSFLFVGVDPTFGTVQMLFNTLSLSCTTGFIPYGVSEIVCDNYNWAQAHYGLNAIGREPVPGELSLSPVPCSGQLSVRLNSMVSPMKIRLTDLRGRCCLEMDCPISPATVNVESLAPGIYFATVVSGEKTYSGKVLIDRRDH
jgi:hypothetical protein